MCSFDGIISVNNEYVAFLANIIRNIIGVIEKDLLVNQANFTGFATSSFIGVVYGGYCFFMSWSCNENRFLKCFNGDIDLQILNGFIVVINQLDV